MFFSPLAGLSLGTYKSTPCRVGQSVRRVGPLVGTNESIDEVICFTDSLSGFSFRVIAQYLVGNEYCVQEYCWGIPQTATF